MTPRTLAWLALVLAACSDPSEAPRALPGDGESRVAAGEATGSEVEPVIQGDAPMVAFLGDSIAAGLHLPASEAFPAVLQRELAAEGFPFRLVNAGRSGDTSAGGLRRIDWLLSQQPDVVVIELGGNDGLRGQDLEGIERNLRAIVRRVKDAGARALLLGMQMPLSYGIDYASGFAELYQRIADDEEIAFVPRFMREVGGRAKLNLEDGLHPNAEGHRKLAEEALPKLRELLGELAER